MCRLIFWTVKFRLWSQDISYSFMHFLKNRVKLEVLVDASSKKGSIIAKTRHWRETSFPGSRYDKRISFHISGTPGRHQWLQSGTDGLSLQVPTWPSLRNATMGVTCRTVTGTVIFLTILIMMFEIELWSLPLELDKGCWVTLHELWLRPLQWDVSKLRKNTLVLFVLIIVSAQDAQVFKAVLKAVVIGIPSFSDLPSWK